MAKISPRKVLTLPGISGTKLRTQIGGLGTAVARRQTLLVVTHDSVAPVAIQQLC